MKVFFNDESEPEARSIRIRMQKGRREVFPVAAGVFHLKVTQSLIIIRIRTQMEILFTIDYFNN
jgi:hypothetical protein